MELINLKDELAAVLNPKPVDAGIVEEEQTKQLNEWVDPGPRCAHCGRSHDQHFAFKAEKDGHKYTPSAGHKPLSQDEAERVGTIHLNGQGSKETYKKIDAVRKLPAADWKKWHKKKAEESLSLAQRHKTSADAAKVKLKSTLKKLNHHVLTKGVVNEKHVEEIRHNSHDVDHHTREAAKHEKLADHHLNKADI